MAITKKVRFEVFKRDRFRCIYCGKTPPAVILEVDHVNPKSKNGDDDINNLVTACFECNRGKRNISLKSIPASLAENLKTIQERELQLKEYNRLMEKVESRLQSDMDEVDKIYSSYFPDWSLSDNFRNNTLKRFLKTLPVHIVKEAMETACDRTCVKADGDDRAIKYFCGICWNKIRDF